MILPPLPHNEVERLHTLRLYRILDTAAEKTFDDLTRLAAAICDTPISLISLVDEKRQWFKARVGLDATETSRDVAFCAYAIQEGELLVVEDALADKRFAQNPLVTSDPSIRFYAGAPLVVSEKQALGALCVIDHKPRQITAHQRDALRILGQAVVTQLELRRAREELQAVERLLAICAWCRSVRVEDGTWRALHEYVMEAVPTTHGICPSCAERVRAPLGSAGA